jgi:hypothetical protein
MVDQLITTTGSWEVPSGVTKIKVVCIGAGGNGGTRTTTGLSGGGGGGARSIKNEINVTPSDTYDITISGDVSFYKGATTHCLAKGGSTPGTNDANGASGGQLADGIGDTKYSGGNGGNGANFFSGGGGGAALDTSNGNNASGSAGGLGGDTYAGAGADGTSSQANGNPGGNYGGGGSGGKRTSTGARTGGAGGSGLVWIIDITPPYDYSFDISDTITTNENSNNNRGRLFNNSDAISLSETINALIIKIISISEQLSLTETFTSLRSRLFTIIENTGIIEVSITFTKKWENLLKSVSSWTNGGKNTSTFANVAKNTSSWNNASKNPESGISTISVNSSSDDGARYLTSSFNTTNTYITVGKSSSLTFNGYNIFRGLNIPKGANILSAKMSLIAANNFTSEGVSLKIYLNNEADAIKPTTSASYDALSVTSDVEWTPADWNVDSAYDTADFATALQEVINRSDWVAGNDINVLIKDNGSTNESYRQYKTYDSSPEDAPLLTVTWKIWTGENKTTSVWSNQTKL